MNFVEEERDRFAARVVARAARCGVELSDDAASRLTDHVAHVLAANDDLHLTSITAPSEFLERHLGESFEGAAEIAPDVAGAYLDLGSGNGYPAIPLVLARPGLTPYLAEASRRKAEFLRAVLADCVGAGGVVERQVQRGSDLEELPGFAVVSARALGNWQRILPRLSDRLQLGGLLLVWAGAAMESVAQRQVWRRYRLVSRRPLPGRHSSWVWKFEKT